VSPSSSSLLFEVFKRNGLTLDDDAGRTLRNRCLAYDAAATDEEIACFAQASIDQHKKNGQVRNWVGLLIKAVPKFFEAPATELTRYREGKRKATEESSKRLREILYDPSSTAEERQGAKAALEGKTPS
jgi:hypothetical protein